MEAFFDRIEEIPEDEYIGDELLPEDLGSSNVISDDEFDLFVLKAMGIEPVVQSSWSAC